MNKKVTVLEVRINQDPIPGWGHEAQDHINWLQRHLDSMIPHYEPEVQLLKIEVKE